MSTTIHEMESQVTDFTFVSQVSHIRIDPNRRSPQLGLNSVSEGYGGVVNSLDLVSDTKKIFITPITAFYHFFNDTVGPLFQQYKMDPDCEVIIDISIMTNDNIDYGDSSLSKDRFPGFFIDMLEKLGIRYRLIEVNKYDVININNFYINNYSYFVGDTYGDFFNLLKNVLGDVEKPSRYVYLSRSKRNVQAISKRPDTRIDDESLLEQYFSELGFDIVYPETFSTFADQVNYMRTVKVLVSITGSGLTNSIFMEPGQTVVELVTPLTIYVEYMKETVEDLHHIYSVMAFKKNHNYIAINNKNKSAQDVIDRIESNLVEWTRNE